MDIVMVVVEAVDILQVKPGRWDRACLHPREVEAPKIPGALLEVAHMALVMLA